MTEYELHHEEIRPQSIIDIPDNAICVRILDITVDLDDLWYCNICYLEPTAK